MTEEQSLNQQQQLRQQPQQQQQQRQQSDHQSGGSSDEENRTSNLFLLLIAVVLFTFYTNLYIEDRASSASSQDNEITAQSILQQCHNFQPSMYQKKYYNVCDPDGMMPDDSTNEYKELIQRNIGQIESYYTMRYGGGTLNLALIMKEEVSYLI